MGQLTGKVAIVTGAGSGMGRSMAELFAKEGAKVVAADVNQDGLDETVKAITDAGNIATGVQTDVTNEAQVKAMVQTAVDQYGQLDILVNNAGIMDNMSPVMTLSHSSVVRLPTGDMLSMMPALLTKISN